MYLRTDVGIYKYSTHSHNDLFHLERETEKMQEWKLAEQIKKGEGQTRKGSKNINGSTNAKRTKLNVLTIKQTNREMLSFIGEKRTQSR